MSEKKLKSFIETSSVFGKSEVSSKNNDIFLKNTKSF
jgi:hypothetical protein